MSDDVAARRQPESNWKNRRHIDLEYPNLTAVEKRDDACPPTANPENLDIRSWSKSEVMCENGFFI